MTGDSVYFKCMNSKELRGLARILEQDDQQVLVQNDSTDVRVQTYIQKLK